jgi:hypothetical protein
MLRERLEGLWIALYEKTKLRRRKERAMEGGAAQIYAGGAAKTRSLAGAWWPGTRAVTSTMTVEYHLAP